VQSQAEKKDMFAKRRAASIVAGKRDRSLACRGHGEAHHTWRAFLPLMPVATRGTCDLIAFCFIALSIATK
jgi:hypothetical protein